MTSSFLRDAAIRFELLLLGETLTVSQALLLKSQDVAETERFREFSATSGPTYSQFFALATLHCVGNQNGFHLKSFEKFSHSLLHFRIIMHNTYFHQETIAFSC